MIIKDNNALIDKQIFSTSPKINTVYEDGWEKIHVIIDDDIRLYGFLVKM